jgi:hypothetical protein
MKIGWVKRIESSYSWHRRYLRVSNLAYLNENASTFLCTIIFLCREAIINFKFIGSWDVMLCNLIERYKRFRRTCCLHLQDRNVNCEDEGSKLL